MRLHLLCREQSPTPALGVPDPTARTNRGNVDVLGRVSIWPEQAYNDESSETSGQHRQLARQSARSARDAIIEVCNCIVSQCMTCPNDVPTCPKSIGILSHQSLRHVSNSS